MTARLTLVAAAMFTLTAVADAQQDTLKTVLAALKAKRAQPVIENYKFTLERTDDSSVFGGQGGANKCSASKDFTVNWTGGTFRAYDENRCDDAYDQLRVFDGVKTHTKFKRLDALGTAQGDWKYGVITGDQRERPFGIEYWPIFYARGIVPNSMDQKVYPGHLKFDPPDDRFFLHRTAGKTVVIRSFPEATNQQHYYEYTIDTSKDYSVTHSAFSLGNDQKLSTLSIDHKQSGKTWAPASWRATVYVGAKVAQVTNVTVRDYSAPESVPSDAFELAFPEGAKVGGTDLKLTKDKKTTSFQLSEYENREGKLIKIGGSPLSSWLRGNWHWLCLGAVACTASVIMFKTQRTRRTPSI